MLGAGAISVFCGGENAVVAACRGVRMIVSVTLNLIIVPVIIVPVIVALVLILMHVCLHDLMLIRATIVRSTIFRSILRADQRRGQRYHRESRQSEQFPRMLAHVLSSFRVWA
jgi:hypothetical protein